MVCKHQSKHPDVNPSPDATQVMQDIGEAYLILKDDEARQKYDAEYTRFKTQYQQKEETTPPTKENPAQSSNAAEGKQTHSSQYARTSTSQQHYTYNDYQFKDDVLEKWMCNAQEQAKKMVADMVDELGGSLKEAGKQAGCTLIGYIVMGSILSIIFAFTKGCH